MIVGCVCGSAWAANPADLTYFERYASGNFGKIVVKERDAAVYYLRSELTSSLHGALTVAEGKSDLSVYRLIWQKPGDLFGGKFNAAIRAENRQIGEGKDYATLDYSKGMFGVAGYIPLDSDGFYQICPRISVGELTGYLTLSEQKDYFCAGASWFSSIGTVEIAWDRNDVVYLQCSKKFKIGSIALYPEPRMKIMRNSEAYEFGLGIAF